MFNASRVFVLFKAACLVICLNVLWTSANAVEMTVQNDSLTNFDNAVIQAGFVANESAAAWLTSPCDGDIRAVQILWRSLNGGAALAIEDSITISEAGPFPTPGATLETIVAPVLTDGVINEYRFLDDMMAVPLIVPIDANQDFVVALRFANTPPALGPSVVTDIDGCQAGRNGIFAIPPGTWFSSCLLGVTGDFVIRAVVDCDANPAMGDLSISKSADQSMYEPGQPLDYTVVASNPGPGTANAVTILDFFPTELTNVSWTCTPSAGASCMPMGSGNITQSVNLPASSMVTFDISTLVDAAASEVIVNEAQLVVPAGFTDPDPGNNLDQAMTPPSDNEIIFADSLES